MVFDFDIYGEVVNGINTYRSIAKSLKNGESVIIGWTDQDYTHFDILFTLNCTQVSLLQRGLRGSDLFVSIMSHSAFGFKTESTKLGDYIQEKLQISGTTCGEKVKQLINGVIKELGGVDSEKNDK